MKRWLRVRPLKTILLIPLFILYRTAWGFGMATGAMRYLSANAASTRAGSMHRKWSFGVNDRET